MWIVIAVVLFIVGIVVIVTTQTNQGQLAKVNADDSSPEIAPGGADIVTSPKTPAAAGDMSVKVLKIHLINECLCECERECFSQLKC